MADPTRLNPGQVPLDQAIRDLGSDLKGWSPSGSSGVIPGKMRGGVRVITWTLDVDARYNHRTETERVGADPALIEAIKENMRRIEEVANVKFEYVSSPDEKEKADIRYFKSDFHGRANGQAISPDGRHREVVLDKSITAEKLKPGSYYYGTVLHETLHAMGLSHPGSNGGGDTAGGDNPSYNHDNTVMSYRRGRLTTRGLGPYDVAVLQHLYSKPKDASPHAHVTDQDIGKLTTLFSDTPVEIDIKDPSATGELYIDMHSQDFAHQMNGFLNGKDIGIRYAPGTQIKDVRVNPESTVRVFATGNALPNHLVGGKRDDVLTPIGGNDTLTGNGGNNEFRFTEESGLNNIITDFKPNNDKIHVQNHAISDVELRYREQDVGGTKMLGTEMLMKDAAGKVVSSFFAQGVTPQSLKPRIVGSVSDSQIRVMLSPGAPAEPEGITPPERATAPRPDPSRPPVTTPTHAPRVTPNPTGSIISGMGDMPIKTILAGVGAFLIGGFAGGFSLMGLLFGALAGGAAALAVGHFSGEFEPKATVKPPEPTPVTAKPKDTSLSAGFVPAYDHGLGGLSDPGKTDATRGK